MARVPMQGLLERLGNRIDALLNPPIYVWRIILILARMQVAFAQFWVGEGLNHD